MSRLYHTSHQARGYRNTEETFQGKATAGFYITIVTILVITTYSTKLALIRVNRLNTELSSYINRWTSSLPHTHKVCVYMCVLCVYVRVRACARVCVCACVCIVMIH